MLSTERPPSSVVEFSSCSSSGVAGSYRKGSCSTSALIPQSSNKSKCVSISCCCCGCSCSYCLPENHSSSSCASSYASSVPTCMSENKNKNSTCQLSPVDDMVLNSGQSLNNQQLDDLAAFGRDWVMMNGGLFRLKETPNSSHEVSGVPFVLFPSPFPRHLYCLAADVQLDFNV